MATYARIVDGNVAEIVSVPEGMTIEEMFHPDLVQTLHPCGENVEEFWLFDGETFSPPPEPNPEPEVVVQLPVNIFFQRTSDEEAEAIDAEMVKQTLRIRRQWQDPTVVFRSDSDLWNILRGVIVELFDEAKADELLAA